jgi:hypothetical protein
MNADRHLDDLELYLQRASILDASASALGGAHGGKVRVLLEGGVSALAKPEAGIGDGRQVVIREVAAWTIARELGWADLVACTVLRDVPLVGGGNGRASVQLLWPDNAQPDFDINAYPDDDVWRAGIFDAVIAHADRGHNWLGLPDESGAYRLKLVDHGYAFDFPGRSFESAFYTRHQGEQMPDQYRARLRRCEHLRQEEHLRELFVDDHAPLDAALARAASLANNGTLTI